MSPDVRRLLAIIDAAYDARSWHGVNLRGSIRGVTPPQAAWRPSPARHNIWELVVHAAYWKYAALRRLTGMRRGSFPLKGSNWFARGAPADARAWRADVALLDRMHRSLRAAVATLRTADLDRTPARGESTAFACCRAWRRMISITPARFNCSSGCSAADVHSIQPPPMTRSPS
jgi:hypothetical protein